MTSDAADHQTSLADELTNTIDRLHSLFDEIGITRHERDGREAKLYAALNAALHDQLHLVAQEKDGLVDECQNVIAQIQQMERSLTGGSESDVEDDGELEITAPLTRCLSGLKEKHKSVKRRHAERYDSIKKLVHALDKYASQLESSIIQIPLPPITNDSAAAASFDLSNTYYDRLEQEFNRVFNEYTRRSATVAVIAKDIITLYAELGTPGPQIDQKIIQFASTEPERLGLAKDDIAVLSRKKAKLVEEREARQARVEELKGEINTLGEKLQVDERQRKMFFAQHRGYDLRCIQALEREYEKLLEMKAANLHVFVNDAREQIVELWDKLYLSQDERDHFAPFQSDVMTDALLSAHEMEIEHLQAVLKENAPILSLVEKHKSLLNDKEQLAISSNDASRLMSRGGGNRDPTRLLREEKMRKRIQRDLPKVEVELKQKLEAYEEEHGAAFLVDGLDYLEVLVANSPVCQSRMGSSLGQRDRSTPVPPPSGMRGRANTVTSGSSTSSRARSRPAQDKQQPARSKTPTSFMRPKTPTGFVRPKTPNTGLMTGSTNRTSGRDVAAPIDRSRSRTPGPGIGRIPQPNNTQGTVRPKTPTHLARPPLTTFSNNPERRDPIISGTQTIGRAQSTKRKTATNGPPKMQDIFPQAAAPKQTTGRSYLQQPQQQRERSRIRSVSPYCNGDYAEEEEEEEPRYRKPPPRHIGTYMEVCANARAARAESERASSQTPSLTPSVRSEDTRQCSITSGSTISTISTVGSVTSAGESENWETYGESDEEAEAEAVVENVSEETMVYDRQRKFFHNFVHRQQLSAAAARARQGSAAEVEEWTSDEGA